MRLLPLLGDVTLVSRLRRVSSCVLVASRGCRVSSLCRGGVEVARHLEQGYGGTVMVLYGTSHVVFNDMTWVVCLCDVTN